MVVLPAGSFEMGSRPDEPERDDDESPAHAVRFERAFALSRFEITREQFSRFADSARMSSSSDGCSFWDGTRSVRDRERTWRSPGFEQGPDSPVVCISWKDAKAYVNWLARTTKQSYRLPSEAEWEYGARGGTASGRPWGEDLASACRHANVADQSLQKVLRDRVSHECDDGYAYTAPVGRFQPNAFGLHDMIGNVWEWVEDCWSAGYDRAPTNGSAWTRGDCGRRVVRGGGWLAGPPVTRAAFRYRNDTGEREESLGFRVARSLP